MSPTDVLPPPFSSWFQLTTLTTDEETICKRILTKQRSKWFHQQVTVRQAVTHHSHTRIPSLQSNPLLTFCLLHSTLNRFPFLFIFCLSSICFSVIPVIIIDMQTSSACLTLLHPSCAMRRLIHFMLLKVHYSSLPTNYQIKLLDL